MHPNLLDTTAFSRGDVDAALAASTHVIEQTFRTQPIEPAFLEPEACLAIPQGKGVKVFSQSQGSTFDQTQIARSLNIPQEEVESRAGIERRLFRRERRTLHPSADGAGGASDGTPGENGSDAETIHAASSQAPPHDAALHRGRRRRRPSAGGAGENCRRRRAAMPAPAQNACCGRRVTPAARIAFRMWMPRRKAVFTNNPTSGAMRGFGTNQAHFAMEGIMDMLAERVGVDGWDIRERNILNPGDAFATGQIMRESVAGLRRSLEAVKDIYKNAKYAGIGCGIKSTGIGNGTIDSGHAAIRVLECGRLDVQPVTPRWARGFSLPSARRCAKRLVCLRRSWTCAGTKR